jgi:hypothetical protein
MKGLLQNIACVPLLASVAYLLAHFAHAQTGQGVMQLNIDDPRPVAKAVEELVSRCGCVITYEDPRFGYSGELEDVTTQVRKDLDRYPAGGAPKVIGPRGGKLTVTLPSPSSINTQTVALALNQLMTAQSIRGAGGRYRVIQVGDVFHVIPTEVRDQNGNWTAQRSILDVPISLPMEDRSEAEMIDAIVKAVSAEAHIKFYLASGVGGGIGNPNRPRPYRLGADNEPARDVLRRALALLNDPKAGTWIAQKLRWQIFYDSPDNRYFLNIAVVPDLPAAPIGIQPQNTQSATTIDATRSTPKK